MFFDLGKGVFFSVPCVENNFFLSSTKAPAFHHNIQRSLFLLMCFSTKLFELNDCRKLSSIDWPEIGTLVLKPSTSEYWLIGPTSVTFAYSFWKVHVFVPDERKGTDKLSVQWNILPGFITQCVNFCLFLSSCEEAYTCIHSTQRGHGKLRSDLYFFDQLYSSGQAPATFPNWLSIATVSKFRFIKYWTPDLQKCNWAGTNGVQHKNEHQEIDWKRNEETQLPSTNLSNWRDKMRNRTWPELPDLCTSD